MRIKSQASDTDVNVNDNVHHSRNFFDVNIRDARVGPGKHNDVEWRVFEHFCNIGSAITTRNG